MKNLLIGSRALSVFCPTIILPDSTDWDIITEEGIPGAEIHDPTLLNNRYLEKEVNKLNELVFN